MRNNDRSMHCYPVCALQINNCGVCAATHGARVRHIGNWWLPQAVPRQAAPGQHEQTHTGPGYASPTPGEAACTNCGVVESTREITVRAQGSGVGAAGGAVAGGLLGNQVGGGHGKEAMTVLGAVGGAVAGNQIEGQVNATHSYEINVRLDDGSIRAIHQAAQPGWQAGDHVKIVDGIVHLNG